MKVKAFFKSLFKLIKIGALALAITAISLQAPYIHKSYIRNIANDSAVQIFGKQGSGSGAHVELANGNVVILTNKHICDMAGPLMVKTENQKLPIARKIIKISDKHDLCILEGVPGNKGIKLGSTPELGDELYTLGHPRGDALNVAKGEYFDNKEIQMAEETKADGTCSEGKLETLETMFGNVSICVVKKNTFQISTPTYPGNSGSPIVNKYGNLVAVVFAGSRSIENMGFAVPFTYVSEFLSSIK